MGMYTEFFFRAELIQDLPDDVFNLLSGIFNSEVNWDDLKLPDHPLFGPDSRWVALFVGSSAYFPDAHTGGFKIGWGNSFNLAIHSSLKNYSGEIDLFLDWISPYIRDSEGTFLGYSLYEEANYPDLYHHKNNEDWFSGKRR